MDHSLSDPTQRVSLDFDAWVKSRQTRIDAHMDGGVPDYAFALDWELRRRLDAIAPLRMLAEALTAGTVPVQRALHEIQGVAVGPRQFPRLHRMGVACAERLGIGVPQLFVVHDPSPNAFTFATGHVDQLIVLTSGLIDALDEDELLYVVGHESGHIHNRHIVYNTAWELLTNKVARRILVMAMRMLGPAGWLLSLFDFALTASSWYVFGRWHRCAEITCDRAGLICSGDLDAAMRVNGKLHLGAIGDLEGFDSDEYKRQARTWGKSWLRVLELTMSHPPGPKRTDAIERFARCDVYGAWRPEIDRSALDRTRLQVDDEIREFLL